MDRLKVMLVDDEPLAIDDLKDMADWEQYGFSVVATAHNGKQALKKFGELRPDVVITDIDMPVMNGIELAKALRAIDDRVRIVFLTAYSDFSYAREGFRYGVDDYMLKNEIDGPALAKRLTTIREGLISERRMHTILDREALCDYLSGRGAEGQEAGESDIEFEKKYFPLFIEEDLPCLQRPGAQKIRLHLRDALAAAGECFPCMQTAMSTRMDENRLLLCMEEAPGQAGETELALRTAAERLTERLMQDYDRRYTCFYLYPALSLSALKERYAEVTGAFVQKYFTGCGRAYNALRLPREDASQTGADINLEKLLLLLSAADGESELTDYIEQNYDEVIAARSYSRLVSLTNTLAMALRSAANKRLPSTAELPAAEGVETCFTAEQVKARMLAQYRRYREQRAASAGLSAPVASAIRCIHERYGDSRLKIETIAEAPGVALSPSRLSVLFKKEMNCTVNEYLTSFRILKAKVLLQENRYKIYEIANMVGYGSSQYFSRVFCQEVGVVPTEYAGGLDGTAL